MVSPVLATGSAGTKRGFPERGFHKPVVWGQRIVLKVRHQKAPQFVSRAALTYGGTSRGKRSCEPWYLLLLTSNLF